MELGRKHKLELRVVQQLDGQLARQLGLGQRLDVGQDDGQCLKQWHMMIQMGLYQKQF